MCERQRKAFAAVPEFCVKDMAAWFRFVVLSTPLLLQGLQARLASDTSLGYSSPVYIVLSQPMDHEKAVYCQ